MNTQRKEAKGTERLIATALVLFAMYAVTMMYPSLLAAAAGTGLTADDSPGNAIHGTAKTWWEDGKIGVGIASAGLLSGAAGFTFTKKISAFVIPAVGGILGGSAFTFADKLFAMGQNMFK